MMAFVEGYLLAGLVTMPLVFGLVWVTQQHRGATQPKAAVGQRLIERVFVSITVAVVTVVIWPVTVLMQCRAYWLYKSEGHLGHKAEEEHFKVAPQHLVERLTREAIETRETVQDPLQGAPEVPFGHLYPAWQAFLANHGRASQSELWSFSAQWQPPWGRQVRVEGYVLVQNGLPAHHFTTVRCKVLAAEASAVAIDPTVRGVA